jgi:hypothetical protein
MFNVYRGGQAPEITITYDDWMARTTLGVLHPRSKDTQELDQALKQYHENKGRGTQAKDAAFVNLKMAFDNWVRARPNWTQSDRNHKRAVTDLHDQIYLVDARRALRDMKDPERWNEMKEYRKAEKQALATLFQSKKLDYKDKLWKAQLTSALNACLIPTATTASSVRTLATSGASGGMHSGAQLSGFTNQVFGGQGVIPNLAPQNSQIYDAAKGTVKEILGAQDASALWRYLKFGAEAVTGALVGLARWVATPVELCAHIVKVARLINDRMVVKRERCMFRSGEPDAALEAILTLINRDLTVAGVNLTEDVYKLVLSAFGGGPMAQVADTVVSGLVNMRLYAQMCEEMEAGNRLLSIGKYDIDLFNASPLLGCYFIVMADAGVWLNYAVDDWGVEGFMDTMAEMYERAQPVREKALSLIRCSKYALSGTEYLGWEPIWKDQKWDFLGRFTNTRPDKLGGIDYLCKQLSSQPSA